jgi:uncharacterized Zn finger protein
MEAITDIFAICANCGTENQWDVIKYKSSLSEIVFKCRYCFREISLQIRTEYKGLPQKNKKLTLLPYP